jgi:hypothetical protein
MENAFSWMANTARFSLDSSTPADALQGSRQFKYSHYLRID